MKSEIMTWRQLSQRPHTGRQVLLDGQLITIRELGGQMDSAMCGRHKLTYLDGAKMMRVTSVKGGDLTAMLASGILNQEDGQ